jgi:hypothetical protein
MELIEISSDELGLSVVALVPLDELGGKGYFECSH